MTRASGRQCGRLSGWACGVVAVTLGFLITAQDADAGAKRRLATKSSIARVAKHASLDEAALMRPLSYSEEFDRAELVERMLTECRGISYNALELAQNSGEALSLPATTQLVVVRVRHPYCAELLRVYAPKTSI
jgi:hypothetical protein